MVQVRVDWSLCRTSPYEHQKVGVKAIIEHAFFFLADEMGVGKTKQTIDAAQFLFQAGLIEKVLVVCPASVRGVWFDAELGELAKHLWTTTPVKVLEFHARIRGWMNGPESTKRMQWMITNYDFIRSKNRLEQLYPFCGPKTMLILDESSAVKNDKAQQTKACLSLRRRCSRVLLLNGTPIANSPLDMYSQANIMHPNILACQSFFHFRSRYAVLGGFQQKQIIGWTNLEDLQRRMSPHILRRLKTDCLDLPEKLPAVTITVPMTAERWPMYKEMRDEMIAWLDQATVSAAPQAIVKAIRLAQLTSGFIGGLSDQSHLLDEDALADDPARPDWLPGTTPGNTQQGGQGDNKGQNPSQPGSIREVGREKLDAFLEQLDMFLGQDPNLKLLVWCRFRPELFRLFNELGHHNQRLNLGLIVGGQKRAEREHALRLLDPRTAPKGPAVVIGTPASGSMGLNLTAAHTVVYMSNDYSLKTRMQSEDRVHRPGQRNNVSYFDIIATGPNGQKTIDHAIMKALRTKEDIARWTTSAWIQALREE